MISILTAMTSRSRLSYCCFMQDDSPASTFPGTTAEMHPATIGASCLDDAPAPGTGF